MQCSKDTSPASDRDEMGREGVNKHDEVEEELEDDKAKPDSEGSASPAPISYHAQRQKNIRENRLLLERVVDRLQLMPKTKSLSGNFVDVDAISQATYTAISEIQA
jgi:hypothetical protein